MRASVDTCRENWNMIKSQTRINPWFLSQCTNGYQDSKKLIFNIQAILFRITNTMCRKSLTNTWGLRDCKAMRFTMFYFRKQQWLGGEQWWIWLTLHGSLSQWRTITWMRLWGKVNYNLTSFCSDTVTVGYLSLATNNHIVVAAYYLCFYSRIQNRMLASDQKAYNDICCRKLKQSSSLLISFFCLLMLISFHTHDCFLHYSPACSLSHTEQSTYFG